MSHYEHRSFIEPVEFRGAENGRTIRAVGVAMRYGARSKPIDGKFIEQFQPATFAKTLSDGAEVRSHNEHHGPYLGATSNGSLTLTDSRSELAYELSLPDTTAGRDAAVLLERRDIKGSSIGFRAMPGGDAWSVDTDSGMALRSVSNAHLGVIDLTIAPYYDDSTAAMALRSLAADKGMEVRSLLEAADRGELPTLIASPPGDDEETEEVPDDSLTSIVRPPLSALMY